MKIFRKITRFAAIKKWQKNNNFLIYKFMPDSEKKLSGFNLSFFTILFRVI